MHTKTFEAYSYIRWKRGKPNQPCNYLNRGHKSKVNIGGQYIIFKTYHNVSVLQRKFWINKMVLFIDSILEED